MNLLFKRTYATTLDDASFQRVLDIYPEERFAARKHIAKALESGEIEFGVLREEADKMLVPWQLFFLEPSKLEADLAHIGRLRHQKVPALAAKRVGSGTITSRRILDRLLSYHSYLSNHHAMGANPYCGSLKRFSSPLEAAAAFSQHLSFDIRSFRSRSKANALAYLIAKAEAGMVNVSQGVLSNKILPYLADSRSVYKSTSGFVIRDEAVPLVFLPSEVNPDERDGRQIFTLTYLLVLIGLDAYNYHIERDFKARMLTAKGKERFAYDVVSEILLPSAETEPLRGKQITAELRDELASRCKLTPTAIIVMLRRRGLLTPADYTALVPPLPPARGAKERRAPVPIKTSVRKFAGQFVFDALNRDLAKGVLKPVQAQYLLFGSVNKRAFREYKKALGI